MSLIKFTFSQTASQGISPKDSLLQVTKTKSSTTKKRTSYDSIPTPFKPKAEYNSFGIKLRPLAFVLGNGGGVNLLVGGEFGFLKNQSVSADGYFYGEDYNRDPYERNDSVISKGMSGGKSTKALFMSYNYYLNFPTWRQKYGLTLYTGLNYRNGYSSKHFDNGYSSDSLIYSTTKFYSYGPQIGAIICNSKKNLSLNVNIVGLLNTRVIHDLYSNKLDLSTNDYVAKTYDLRVGLNLYWWFKY